MSCVCHAFASVHSCHMVTCRQMADISALVCDVHWDFVTFPFGILGRVWCLNLPILDPCCLSYFEFCLYFLSSGTHFNFHSGYMCLEDFLEAATKKQVSMIRKYHNHTLQANPWHPEAARKSHRTLTVRRHQEDN